MVSNKIFMSSSVVLAWTLTVPLVAHGREAGITLEARAGVVEQTTVIRIRNACSQPHEFVAKVKGLQGVERQGDRSAVVVPPGNFVEVPFAIRSENLSPKTYRGTLVIKCKDCKKEPGCSQSREQIPVELRVAPAPSSQPTGGGPAGMGNHMTWIGLAHNEGTVWVLEQMETLAPPERSRAKAQELAAEWVASEYPNLDRRPIRMDKRTRKMIETVVRKTEKEMDLRRYARTLDSLDRRAARRLKGRQLDLYYMASATARASTTLWRSLEDDGQGGEPRPAAGAQPVPIEPDPKEEDEPKPVLKKLKKWLGDIVSDIGDWFDAMDWGKVGKADINGCVSGGVKSALGGGGLAGGASGCLVGGVAGSAGNLAGQSWDYLNG